MRRTWSPPRPPAPTRRRDRSTGCVAHHTFGSAGPTANRLLKGEDFHTNTRLAPATEALFASPQICVDVPEEVRSASFHPPVKSRERRDGKSGMSRVALQERWRSRPRDVVLD